MRGRLIDLTKGRNGHERISVEIDGSFGDDFDALKDGDVDVEIKKFRNKRSISANAYAWVLISKIAAVMNEPMETIYRQAIRNIGGVSDVVCVVEEAAENVRRGWESRGIGWQAETLDSKIQGCVNLMLYYGSSSYDSKQMSQLIESLCEDARSLGIETEDPGYISSLIEQWEGKTQ